MIFLREALTTLLCEEGFFSCISKHLPRKTSRTHPDQMPQPPRLLSKQKSSGSTLSLSQMSVLLTLISKAEASHPAE